jgi:drug/metabolite transporter (DMT)-like permease
VLQLCFLGLIWGSSFILIKKSLVGLDSVQVGCFRVGIAFLAFLPFVFLYRKEIEWSRWPKFLLIGLTTSGIPSFCFSIAQTHVSSAVAGILNALTPICALLISVWFFHAKFQMGKLLGVLIGFMGAALLLYSTDASVNGSNLWYAMLIFFATVCYGLNSNAVKKFFSDTRPIVITAGAFFFMGAPFFLYLLFHGDFITVLQDSSKHSAFVAVTILSLLCTVLANIVFFDLVQKTNAVFASTVTFLIPLVAVVLGFFDGEAITFYHLFAMICILAALIIIRRN